jgi:hypothetical protein
MGSKTDQAASGNTSPNMPHRGKSPIGFAFGKGPSENELSKTF